VLTGQNLPDGTHGQAPCRSQAQRPCWLEIDIEKVNKNRYSIKESREYNAIDIN